jgi:hypothetical protein
MKLAAQLGSWVAALAFALTVDAVLIVFTIFIDRATASFQASAVCASTSSSTLGVALAGSALVLLADLSGGAVVGAIAHTVFENAGTAAASLVRFTVRILTALRAVFLETVLSLFAVLVATAVWKLGFFVRARAKQRPETEDEQQPTESGKLLQPSRS